ncbi:hypothetical protein CYMTET_54803 [Cymbomonas tetramitiformis]|uniref:Fringe-like glycosyltransferase domain-containing protein n=1 Tax=Cymbomonas tetramitiformis TaxID=36881 RepID=A0AAE0BG09_9CHLO|nr:hypothetical protein CYMTET_54803 [Cymbomonas tetramitiformis]
MKLLYASLRRSQPNFLASISDSILNGIGPTLRQIKGAQDCTVTRLHVSDSILNGIGPNSPANERCSRIDVSNSILNGIEPNLRHMTETRRVEPANGRCSQLHVVLIIFACAAASTWGVWAFSLEKLLELGSTSNQAAVVGAAGAARALVAGVAGAADNTPSPLCVDFGDLRPGNHNDSIFQCLSSTPYIQERCGTPPRETWGHFSSTNMSQARLRPEDVVLLLVVGCDQRRIAGVLESWVAGLWRQVDNLAGIHVVVAAEAKCSGTDWCAPNASREEYTCWLENKLVSLRSRNPNAKVTAFYAPNTSLGYPEAVTSKQVQLFPWLQSHFPDAKHFVKVEDDTFVLPGNLFAFLYTLHDRLNQETPALYGNAQGDQACCCRCCGAWEFDGCYPQGGSGWGFNKAALEQMAGSEFRSCYQRLFERWAPTHELHSDVTIGFCYHEVTNEPLIHCGSFHANHPSVEEQQRAWPNRLGVDISYHHVGPDDMRRFWDGQTSRGGASALPKSAFPYGDELVDD